MAALTFAQVSQLLKYDPQSGKLFWKKRPPHLFRSDSVHSQTHIAARWNDRYAEREAFTAVGNHGYRFGQIAHHPYTAHMVIWLLIHREWPTLQIDHINGDRQDNRLSNLRMVTDAENKRNMKRPKNNTSGSVGVYWVPHCRKWQAYINRDRKRTNLGLFEEFSDAAYARKCAELKFGFHPNHGRCQASGAPVHAVRHH